MPETIVVHKGHGLPYSKGLMAQSLSATGLKLERCFELARIVERRLAERGAAEVDVGALRALTEEVLLAEEGGAALRRFRDWHGLDRLDRPLVVLLGGTTGVGKSTLATMLAGRLGITRVIATDVVRQVLRAFFTQEAMPSVHYSAFEAGEAVRAARSSGGADARPGGALEAEGEDADVEGYRDQAERVGTAITAIVERAVGEGQPLIVEGVHVLPGTLDGSLRASCAAVEALLVVDDEGLHRGHLSLRRGARPAERYLRHFGEIRKLQEYLTRRAREEGVPVVHNENVDATLGRLMEHVLDAVGALGGERA
jgi:2-phosphoglycerate kinase